MRKNWDLEMMMTMMMILIWKNCIKKCLDNVFTLLLFIFMSEKLEKGGDNDDYDEDDLLAELGEMVSII